MREIPVIAALCLASCLSAQTYPVAFNKDTRRTRTDRQITSVALGEQSLSVPDVQRMYTDLTAKVLVARPGQKVTPAIGFTGNWMDGYVYIDKNRNGAFDVSAPGYAGVLDAENDLVSFSGLTLPDGLYNSAGMRLNDLSSVAPPAFTLPETLEAGYYMMRFKVDWDDADPAGRMDEANGIIRNGGGIVDVRLYVTTDKSVQVHADGVHGKLVTLSGEDLEGQEMPVGESFALQALPDDGYKLTALRIWHGDVAATDSVVNGVAQYAEDLVPCSAAAGGVVEVDGAYVDGTLVITGVFEPRSDAETEDYVLVFNDEFDQPDGSEPDPAKWVSSVRYSSTWNRYIADDSRVRFIDNGHLVCRAIPNPDTSADPVPMLTGSVETRGKFAFTYGRVEVRLRTVGHRGSFPAAWMMPQPPCAAWPNAGEIDIFESIDASPVAYHTLHSNWIENLGNKWNPTSSFSESCNVEQWHVYGVDWTPDRLTFTLDGKTVGTYERQGSTAAVNGLQWPFDHDFYIILNQSVGDGSWAQAADTGYTYETLFDYVRVFQLRPVSGIQTPVSDSPTSGLYDLQGRRVTRPQRGVIYIRNGRKVVY